MKTTATIYDSPGDYQTVLIDFEYRWISPLFRSSTIEVNYLKILEPIQIKPSDLDTDLCVSIAEKFGLEIQEVSIACEVECNNIITQPKISEPLFV